MIERNLAAVVAESARNYPIVTVTGPRQSGKTTLCRSVFPEKKYVSLEPFDVREYARRDPRGFLEEHRDGAIIDEVQHAPDLPGYLQVEVDRDPVHGRFVLTGSQHFGLTAAVSQSLAGRTAVLELLPLALDELERFENHPSDLFDVMWQGAYPRIHDRGIPADRWLADYITTYVQRDVRQVLAVADLQAFTLFIRLAAGRTGQVLNTSALAADCGVSHNTARSWLSVLETGYLVRRLPAWHRNLRKRLTRSPKLHFLDSGLVCRLLGIADPEQLRHHPLRGPIFESWVVAEILKHRVHRGLDPSLSYYRDSRQLEVDIVLERAGELVLAEVKSGKTVATDAFGPLTELTRLVGRADGRPVLRRLIHGGDESHTREGVMLVPWKNVPRIDW
jgi:predicted AAA+ superfamily ATPase